LVRLPAFDFILENHRGGGVAFEAKSGVSDEDPRLGIAAHQRRYFNALADLFAVPQSEAVMDRLGQIVAAGELHAGDVVLDVETGAGVLIPLIESYRPSLVLACDLAEQMLARVHRKYHRVCVSQCDIV
jgi:hypothetical protein